MNAEITKELFRTIVTSDTPATKVENLELARIIRYRVSGTNLFTITNYVSGTIQYFVEDINA